MIFGNVVHLALHREHTRQSSQIKMYNFVSVLAYLILPLKFSYQLPLINIPYRPWRLLTFLFSVPLALGALMLFFFHESPKFLANKGDTEKAMEVLRDMYEKNGGKKEDYVVCISEKVVVRERTLNLWMNGVATIIYMIMCQSSPWDYCQCTLNCSLKVHQLCF